MRSPWNIVVFREVEMMGIKSWIQRQLGIELLDSRTSRLEDLEMFSLQDVVDKLSESMIVLTSEGQILKDVNIVVPPEKTGVLVLGKNTMVQGCFIRGVKTRTITEVIEEDYQSSKEG